MEEGIHQNRDFAGGGVVMGLSTQPQDADDYKVSQGNNPSDVIHSQVWYWENSGSLEFHLDLYNSEEYRGHVSFRLKKSKILESLQRMKKTKR